MARFEELQNLWQEQALATAPNVDGASLAGDFRRFGRRQDLINLGKSVLVVFQFDLIVTRLRHHPVQMFGAMLAGFSIVYFLLFEWRNQRAVARLNFAAPSADFVRTAIARLKALRNPFRGPEFLVMMGGFVVGFNIMMVGRWPTLPTIRLVIYHSLITLFLLLIYRPSVYLRGKRWDHECRPLVERLTALLAAIEEHPE